MKQIINLKTTTLAIFLAVFLANFANSSEIAILDVDRIVKESKAMKYIQETVSKQQDKYQKEVTKKQQELETEQKRVEGKKSLLSEEAFAKEVKDFENKIDELKTFVDRRQNSLKKASLDAMSKVNEKVKEIITDISKEKNIDVLVPSSQALYYKENLDISEEVLTKLNKKITKVSIKFDN